jgi:glycosyltransferase involved in cell wall biosynthesis
LVEPTKSRFIFLSRIKQNLGKVLPPSLKLWLKALLARFTGEPNRRQSPGRSVSKPQPSPGALSEGAARIRPSGLRILVCDDHVPTPGRDAGSARMWLILKSLLKLGQPVFVSMSSLHQPDYEAELRKEGVETAFWADYKQLLREQDFDVAILSRPDVAEALLSTIRKTSPGTRIIFDTVDISFVRFDREYKLSGDKNLAAEAKRFRSLEGRLARDCDEVWCVTKEDQAALALLATAARFEIIPTIHPLQERGKAFAEREGAVFIGNYRHRPNEDAVHHFMRDILPLVQTACPEFKLFIVGDHAPAEIRAYASDNVIVTGYLPEVDEIFYNCRVFVAPLRFGSGMKGKIGQAMSYGVPVVTTSIGAEGMGLENGCQAIIADSAQEFADAVINLYQDVILWQRLSDNAFEHVRQNFTPEVVEEKIHNAVLNLVSTES